MFVYFYAHCFSLLHLLHFVKYPAFKAGEHLWARTIDAFPYLNRKYKSGELAVDFMVADENPFKRLSIEEAALKES